MAMRSGFFNAVKSSGGTYDRTYDAAFFTHFISNVFYSAVPEGSFVVSAGSGLTVNVSSGFGFVDGIYFYDDSVTPLTLAYASGSRTDLIVARLDTAGRTVALAINQGTVSPASNEVALAQVTVSGNAIAGIVNVEYDRIVKNVSATASGEGAMPQIYIDTIEQHTSDIEGLGERVYALETTPIDGDKLSAAVNASLTAANTAMQTGVYDTHGYQSDVFDYAQAQAQAVRTVFNNYKDANDTAISEMQSSLNGSISSALDEAKSYADTAIDALDMSATVVVDTLPELGDPEKDYILGSGGNYFYYKWINSAWHQIGDTTYIISAALNAVIASDEFASHGNRLSAAESGIVSAEQRITSNEEAIDAINRSLRDLDTSGSDYDITYANNILTLYENDQIKTQVTITGGSGGAQSSTIEIQRITDTELTTVLGDSLTLQYSFTSVDSQGDSTGNATAVWSVGSRSILTETIGQGANSLDVGSFLTAGNNTVWLRITDSMGNIGSKSWTISVVDLRMETSFDDTQIYTADTVVRYTPHGDISKTIHFVLDGADLETATVTSTGRQQSLALPMQTHGAHSLVIWATATVNGIDISSNRIYLDIMFAEAGSTTPIIKCAWSGENVQQYSSQILKYCVYTPNSETSDISLKIDGVIVAERTVDRSEHEWNYKPTDYGNKLLTIECGGVSKNIQMTVIEFPYEIAPVTTGLAFDFNPSGRANTDANYNTYTDHGYSMSVSENFDWNNGGWKNDSEGNSYFCVKAGTTMTLDFPLFGDDAKLSGKDFKLIYKATQCRDFNALVMECLEGNGVNDVGISVTAQSATLYAGGTSLNVPYCEDTYMELEFNIQPASMHSEMLAVIDGDYSKVATYTSADNFDQHTTNVENLTAPVTFGSDDCDVWIYRFKAYSNCLSDDEIMDNRIADAPNAVEMAACYTRNAVVNSSGQLDPDLLAEVCPDLRVILITCPKFTNGKGDKIQGCTVKHIYKEGGVKHCWTATDVELQGQGTSSNGYGDSARNLDIDCKGGYYCDDGSYSDVYSMTDNSIGVSYFNIKVNVASSENANNACLADDYNTYQPYLRTARQNDTMVRDTMEFHPCVIFVEETDIAASRVFHDGKMHFYACGDFGNSKKNNEALGMDSENANECIVEIVNNTDAACLFKSNDLQTTNSDGDLPIEFRYPKNPTATINSAVQRLWDWIVSTDTSAATDQSLSTTDRNVASHWTVHTSAAVNHTTDSAAYRADKFVNQFDDYFISDSVMYHYLFTERHTMVDSRAKNTFLHTSDGLHWDFVFDYDNDTADGNNNEGDLVLEYGMEDIDTIGSKSVFNAADSVLWVNVRRYLFSRLKAMFIDRESAGAWDAQRILQKFNSYQWVKPERLEMADMRRKYLRPFEDLGNDTFLPMLYGRKTHQRKRFEIYQEMYMSSKYRGTACTNDLIEMRCYSAENNEIRLTPYAAMYANILVGSHAYQERVQRGQEVVFDFSELTDLNDTETYIYSASKVQAIGDLSPLKIGRANFARAEKLRTLMIGSGAADYCNTNITQIGFGANPLLAYLDLRGCQNLSDSIDLSGCISLSEFYSSGTSISGLTFANGGLLKTAYINAVATVSLKNLRYLTALTFEGYDNLSNLTVENCPNIDTLAIVTACMNLTERKLVNVRLTGINWTIATDAVLEYLYDIGAQLEGSVHVNSIGAHTLERYNSMWQNLTITYTESIPEYLVTWVNYDSTVLYETYVKRGGSATYVGAVPTRPSTAQYDYTFSGWSAEAANVNSAMTISAQYSETVRQYTVRWWSDGTVIATQTVDYGSAAVYSGETPTMEYDCQGGWIAYLFDGWDTSTDSVTADVDVYAQFKRVEYVVYKFANANAKMSANSSLGFTACGENIYLPIYRAYDLENSTSHYTSSKEGTSYNFRIGLSLPFDVILQSVSIADAPTNPAASGAWYSFPYGGKIYTSESARSGLYTGTDFEGNGLDEWVDIGDNGRKTDANGNVISSKKEYDTAYPDPTQHITTHANASYNQKTRYIQYNPTWGGGSYKCIGEITLTFKVLRSDLEAWAEQYGVQNLNDDIITFSTESEE